MRRHHPARHRHRPTGVLCPGPACNQRNQRPTDQPPAGRHPGPRDPRDGRACGPAYGLRRLAPRTVRALRRGLVQARRALPLPRGRLRPQGRVLRPAAPGRRDGLHHGHRHRVHLQRQELPADERLRRPARDHPEQRPLPRRWARPGSGQRRAGLAAGRARERAVARPPQTCGGGAGRVLVASLCRGSQGSDSGGAAPSGIAWRRSQRPPSSGPAPSRLLSSKTARPARPRSRAHRKPLAK
jgi:hypothetical protein